MLIDTVFNMNCLEGMDMIPTGSIDMILTDLPYGTTRNKWDTIIPFNLLWPQFERVIKDNGAICLWAQAPFSYKLAMSNLKLFRYEWIIVKKLATGFLNSHKMSLKAHENILVFYKKLPCYNPQMEKGKPYIKKGSEASNNYSAYGSTITVSEGGRWPKDVITLPFTDRGGPYVHSTMKPIEANRYMIRTYAEPGDTVLDACIGTGSTAIAAMREGRHFIGYELDKGYYDKCIRRIEAERFEFWLVINWLITMALAITVVYML